MRWSIRMQPIEKCSPCTTLDTSLIFLINVFYFNIKEMKNEKEKIFKFCL